ncbi:MAG: PAS domain S-box protein, partial [Nitrospiraceae bacterium]
MKEDNNITSSLTLEAKRLKKELSDRDEICRFITGSAVDAIISIDEKEKIFLWNPAAEKLFGY